MPGAGVEPWCSWWKWAAGFLRWFRQRSRRSLPPRRRKTPSRPSTPPASFGRMWALVSVGFQTGEFHFASTQNFKRLLPLGITVVSTATEWCSIFYGGKKKSAHFFPFCSASSKFSRNLENIWKSNKNIWIKPHEVTLALLRHHCREEQFYSLVTIISLQPKISRQSNLSLFDQPTSSRPSWCLKLLRQWWIKRCHGFYP